MGNEGRNRHLPDGKRGLGLETAVRIWATPTVQDANGRDRHNQRDGSVRLSLLGQVRMRPGREGGFLLKEVTSGALNPAWVGYYLMGFPLDWEKI